MAVCLMLVGGSGAHKGAAGSSPCGGGQLQEPAGGVSNQAAAAGAQQRSPAQAASSDDGGLPGQLCLLLLHLCTALHRFSQAAVFRME